MQNIYKFFSSQVYNNQNLYFEWTNAEKTKNKWEQ